SIADLLEEEGGRPFDLSRAPLLRMVLLKLDSEEHVLITTTHHLIWDGWSAELCGRELSALYDAYRKGLPSPLAELSIQYADYAMWQRARLHGPRLHEQLSYWKHQLEGELPVLELPVDRKRQAGANRRRGAVETFQISRQLLQKLQHLGQRDGATLYM